MFSRKFFHYFPSKALAILKAEHCDLKREHAFVFSLTKHYLALVIQQSDRPVREFKCLLKPLVKLFRWNF